ncbi:MAG TPA: hypothetical protein PK413_05335 [Thermoanaerobaculia bacterium]|nr:hypothetical protein [Thermoanaerobaculia bacterium]
MAGLWLLVGVVVLVLAVILEGKRQGKKYGKGTGRAAMKAGFLELQQLLEPQRKVELLLEEREETEQPGAGAPPEGGGRQR